MEVVITELVIVMPGHFEDSLAIPFSSNYIDESVVRHCRMAIDWIWNRV